MGGRWSDQGTAFAQAGLELQKPELQEVI